MTEHSIQVDLSDPRAKAIADVLGNKSCKKILELFAEKEEVSESDIASALGLPLNTVGYNVKKLLNAGLIEKSKNFFWSMKGKRIATYRLSNKRIIISPKRMISAPVVIIAGIALIGIIAILIVMQNQYPDEIRGDDSMKKFNSLDELKSFIKERSEAGYGYGSGAMLAAAGAPSTTMDSGANTKAGASPEASANARDYSTTNIQVEGVDEPDIVKNDGKYIYAVSGNKIVLVEAYPAEQMKKVGEIALNGSSIREIFVKGDKLIVLGEYYSFYSGCDGDVCIALAEPSLDAQTGAANSKMIAPYRITSPRSFVYVYDITTRENPKLVNNITQDGNYREARLIGEYVYTISSSYIGNNIMLPFYSVNGNEKRIGASEIYRPDTYDSGFVFTGVLSVSLENGEASKKAYLTGSSNTIYASEDNIYITGMKRVSMKEYYNSIISEVIIPILPNDKKAEVEKILTENKDYMNRMSETGKIVSNYIEGLTGEEKAKISAELEKSLVKFSKEFSKDFEKTIVHKININEGEINYIAAGEVPGRMLNQFSLDEYKGNLRVATTTSGFRDISGSLNHLYVLDKNMKIIGSVQDLAKGETIYSVRFIKDKAYMVTFKKVDPLYVIDLTDEENPKVLGYLKIPGYSNYLHPYDENHIIGIGKDAVETSNNLALYQGMKISLFDVTDFENPKEEASLVIGDRGTDSYALSDHKAFLFSKERNLLVLPINLAEINKSKYSKYGEKIPDWAYGDSVWRGAYVLNISEKGISVRGRITHFDNESDNNQWRFYDSRFQIQRSLYMDNVLYTMSPSAIKANNLSNLNEINKVEIFSAEENRVYY